MVTISKIFSTSFYDSSFQHCLPPCDNTFKQRSLCLCQLLKLTPAAAMSAVMSHSQEFHTMTSYPERCIRLLCAVLSMATRGQTHLISQAHLLFSYSVSVCLFLSLPLSLSVSLTVPHSVSLSIPSPPPTFSPFLFFFGSQMAER